MIGFRKHGREISLMYDHFPWSYRTLLISNHRHKRSYRNVTRSWCPGWKVRWDQGDKDFGRCWFNMTSHSRNLLLSCSSPWAKGKKKQGNYDELSTAITAGSVYVSLLQVPGSGAFRIFQAEVYDHILCVLKAWQTLQGSGNDAEPARSSGKRRGRKRNRHSDVDDTNEIVDFDEEEEVETMTLTPRELKSLHSAMFNLLKDLVSLLASHSLKSCEHAASETIHILMQLARLQPETLPTDPNLTADVKSLRTVPDLVYRGLLYMCQELHGKLYLQVLRQLLPNILMLLGTEGDAVAAQTIPRSAQLAKDHAVFFICHLLEANKEEAQGPVRVLLQHMCTKVPDKTEYRTKIGQAIVKIMRAFSVEAYAHFLEWLYKFSRNAKINYRSLALDLFVAILHEDPIPPGDASEDIRGLLSENFLIQLIIARCSDIAPTVRARAISTLAQCTMTTSKPHVAQTLRDLMTPRTVGKSALTRIVPTPDVGRVVPMGAQLQEGSIGENQVAQSSNDTVETESAAASQSQVLSETPALNEDGMPIQTPQGVQLNTDSMAMRTLQLTPGISIDLADGKGVISMLRRRAGDQKLNVRKSSIQALEAVLKLQDEDMDPEIVEVLVERCRDPGLSVRKQCVQSLTDLLYYRPSMALLQRAWLNALLPLVADRETSVQDKCLDVLYEVMLAGILPKHSTSEEENCLPWKLLDHMAQNDQAELRGYFELVCSHWGQKGLIKLPLIKAIETFVGTEHNAGAWLLLSNIAAFMPKVNTAFIVNYWRAHVHSTDEGIVWTLELVLKVLGHMASQVATQSNLQLVDDLRERLNEFTLPPQLVSCFLTTLSKLCSAQETVAECTQRNSHLWFNDLLKAADSYLSTIILNEHQDGLVNEEKLICHLVTLGEVAQLCPDRTPRRAFMLVESLVAAPTITSTDGSSQDPGSSQGADLLVLSQFRGSNMSTRVRAYAFTTLGKLCLQNEDLAKSVIPALSRELETSKDPAIRNNVVIIMCDLCVRYTNMIDRYVSNIATCLRDDAPLIRKQTLTLLTRLLQEDYLKWKGCLFYRYVFTLVDDNQHIANFAAFCLVHLILQRHPNMFFQHFVEAVYHFNAYAQHNVYNQFPQTERERELFSLQGKTNARKRMVIYRFMLDNMQDHHKFQLTAKLTQDVLGAVVDEVIPFDDASVAVVEDALQILTCKEIKLASLRTTNDDIAETETEMEAMVLNVAQKQIITKVMKKNVIENIVPTVMSLKHMFERNRSSSMQYLMAYLCDLMKEYKTEVKDILAGDQQLAAEIEFDIQRFEQHTAESQRPLVGQTPQAAAVLQPTQAMSPARTTVPGTLPRRSGVPQSPLVGRTPKPGKTTAAGARTPRTEPILNAALQTFARRHSILSSPASIRSGSSSEMPSTPTKTPVKRVGFVEPASPDISSNPVTPVGTGGNRAVSTPCANDTLSNLTFHQANLSVIQGSPTPSSATRGPSRRRGSRSISPDSDSENRVLCLNLQGISPGKVRKPKPWNVKPPKETVTPPSGVVIDILVGVGEEESENTGGILKPVTRPLDVTPPESNTGSSRRSSERLNSKKNSEKPDKSLPTRRSSRASVTPQSSRTTRGSGKK